MPRSWARLHVPKSGEGGYFKRKKPRQSFDQRGFSLLGIVRNLLLARQEFNHGVRIHWQANIAARRFSLDGRC